MVKAHKSKFREEFPLGKMLMCFFATHVVLCVESAREVKHLH